MIRRQQPFPDRVHFLLELERAFEIAQRGACPREVHLRREELAVLRRQESHASLVHVLQELVCTLDVAQQLKDDVPFDSLASMHHAPMMDRVADDMPQDGLGEEYLAALRGAQPGDVLGPVLISMGGDLSGWAVLDFMGSRPAGEFTFDDLRDQIRRALTDQNALSRYLDALKERTYIEVRF